MAWTDPRTWVTGELVTAALMNTHLRDNLKAIGDPWTSYTPAVTNWTLGNGTVTGNYVQAGKLVHYRATLTIGSTTTFSGFPGIGVPVAGKNVLDRTPMGQFTLKDVSPSTFRHYYAVSVQAGGTNATSVTPVTEAGATVSPTVPWTWAAGDWLMVAGTYEAA